MQYIWVHGPKGPEFQVIFRPGGLTEWEQNNLISGPFPLTEEDMHIRIDRLAKKYPPPKEIPERQPKPVCGRGKFRVNPRDVDATAPSKAAEAVPLAPAATVGEARAKALVQGYTGDCCASCGSFSMIRSGTCLRCEACGSTTGCS